ncbi:MAG: TonB-dependent receptor, partial [Gemmataceae bacterium]
HHRCSTRCLWAANGEVVQPADILHKKCILVERGSFRPITKVTLDMLECAKSMFVQEPDVEGSEILVIMEMTLKNLLDQGKIDYQDFLDRVDTLASLGKTVLISNFGEYHRLAAYFFRYTKKMIGIVMGVPTLKEIFDERYYADLEGGILESFGRLFKNKLKLFIYPLLEKDSKALITADNLVVQNHLKHLYSYLIENNFIESIRGYDSKCLSIFSRDVLDKIRRCDNSWETMVPESVIEIIKSRGFFNHKLTT